MHHMGTVSWQAQYAGCSTSRGRQGMIVMLCRRQRRSLGQVGGVAAQRGAPAGPPAEAKQLPQHPQKRADHLCKLQLTGHSQPCHSHVCPRRPSLIQRVMPRGDSQRCAGLHRMALQSHKTIVT